MIGVKAGSITMRYAAAYHPTLRVPGEHRQEDEVDLSVHNESGLPDEERQPAAKDHKEWASEHGRTGGQLAAQRERADGHANRGGEDRCHGHVERTRAVEQQGSDERALKQPPRDHRGRERAHPLQSLEGRSECIRQRADHDASAEHVHDVLGEIVVARDPDERHGKCGRECAEREACQKHARRQWTKERDVARDLFREIRRDPEVGDDAKERSEGGGEGQLAEIDVAEIPRQQCQKDDRADP
jgi:hypothetical protein